MTMRNITNGFVLRPVPQLLFPLVEKTREQVVGKLIFPTPYSCVSGPRNSWEQLGTAGNNSSGQEGAK